MNPFLGASTSSTETSNTASSLYHSPQTPPRWITSTHAPPPLSGLLLPPPAFTRGPQALGYPHDRPPLPPLLLAPHQTAPTPLTHESLMATAAAHLYSHAHRLSDHFDHRQSPLPPLPFAAPAKCPHPQPWPLTNSPTAGAAPPRPQEASTPQHKVMLQIGVQPPNRTVYQRLLKPYPSVYLIAPPLPSGPDAPGAGTRPAPSFICVN